MNSELKAKWVEALRGGKYTQGDGNLHYRRGGYSEFCCLGVLCDTQGTNWSRFGDDGIWDGVQVRDQGRSYLSTEILDRVGLTDKQQTTLGEMNDRGRSFSEIADYIEANL